MSSRKFGAELLFDSAEPGGTITEVFDDGLAKRMKLLVDDIVLEVKTSNQTILMNTADDAESMVIPANTTVSILFRKASDNKLHRRTIVVKNYTFTFGEPCFKAVVDEATFVDEIVDG